MPIISAHGRLRQEDHKFKVSLGSYRDPVSRKLTKETNTKKKEGGEEEE
jgi:hypothetical protein